MSKQKLCKHVIRLITAILLWFPLVETLGQIVAPKADYIDVTSYVKHPKEDSVFVFNKASGQGTDSLGALQVSSPNGEDDWVFRWYMYHTELNDFDFSNPLLTENNTNFSTIDNLTSGGYAVVLSDGVFTDTLTAWVFINNFRNIPIRITHKNDEGNLLPSRYTCEYVELKADVETDTFYYYDLSNDSMLVLNNYINYSWTSDPQGKNPSDSDNRFTGAEIRDRTYDPPTEDTYYFLEVADKYGVTQFDTVFYETIQTKAVLDTIAPPVSFSDGGQYYNNQKKDTKSAPYQMFFSPKESENAARFVWSFGEEEDDTTYFTPDSVEYIFYDPLKSPYTVHLTTYSEENCMSSDSVEIEIAESQLSVPPFFSPKENQPTIDKVVTPNGDGNNDYFRVYDVSIREFEIIIFNRWGRVVNRSEGNDIREWKGWDGYVGNSQRPAPEGVYYFVLRARGWDGLNYVYPDRDAELRGFFHLFRENQR